MIPFPRRAESGRTLHEADVHAIELEMQNCELRLSRDKTDALLEKYTDLYDFAPIAYLILASDGTIRLVNLAAAHLLGSERTRLLGRQFGSFVAPESQPEFHAFLHQALAGRVKQLCDLVLLRKGRSNRIVNIAVQRLPGGQECRATLVDITDREKAETQVRASEVRFRRLFEAAHDGVLLLDPKTRKITDANPFMTKLLGYPNERLVGKELFEIGLLKDEFASQEMLRKLKKDREARYENLPLLSRSGRRQEVEVVANLYQENGHIVIQCNIRDITARKLMERALYASEERYRILFDSASVAIYSCDTAGVIEKFNGRAVELWGREPKLGETNARFCGSFKLFRPNGRFLPRAECPMAEVLHGKMVEARNKEVIIQRPDGSRVTCIVNISALKNEQGKITGAINCFYDITERKRAEDVLRRNEALFSALVAQAPVGVYVVDSRLQLQQVNPVAEGAFKNIKPLLGRSLSEVTQRVWPRRAANQIVRRFRQTLRTGKPYRSPEFTERRRDSGAQETYEWQIQRVTLPAGKFGVVCFFSDLTERRKNEEAQRRLKVMASANRELHGEITRRQAVEKTLRESERHQRQLQEQSKQLAHRLLNAQEEERLRISRELHDQIAQTLVSINVGLVALKAEAGVQGRGSRRQFARAERLMKKSIDIVHRFASDLRPTLLDDLGLIPALHELLKKFRKRTGLRVRLTIAAEANRLDVAKRTVLYRVAQEALTNVERHAQASSVEIVVQVGEGRVSMTIRDNGKCPRKNSRQQARQGKRLGVIGMRERLEMVGGSFHIQCVEGKGTTVDAQVPFE